MITIVCPRWFARITLALFDALLESFRPYRGLLVVATEFIFYFKLAKAEFIF